MKLAWVKWLTWLSGRVLSLLTRGCADLLANWRKAIVVNELWISLSVAQVLYFVPLAGSWSGPEVA